MAILACEMFGLLMLMKNDFIVEDFIAIVAKWFKITEVSFFSSHFKNEILIKKKLNREENILNL